LLLWAFALSVGGFVVLLVERGEPVHIDARTVSIYVREAVARTWFSLSRPFGAWGVRPVAGGPPSVRKSPPILLVPGYAQNRSSLAWLHRFLLARGFRWVWAVNHPRRNAGLAERAAALGQRVAELRAATGAEQVDIIGHSLGGLVAAWYCRRLGGEAHVRRLVTIGTPWRGTRLAIFAREPVAREISYGSHVLDGLAPPGVSAVSIWSPDDPVVVPSQSAVADGVESVCVDSAGHHELLVSARVFRAVLAALAHAPIRTAEVE
jgi:triacylglycerol esterase/lipase EstA (alpha/beta hydrolase family)